MVELLVGTNADGPADRRLELTQDAAAFILQGSGGLRIYPQDNAVSVEIGAHFVDLGEDVVADRGARLDRPGARAIGTRLGQRALEAALDALARDDDEAEVGYLDRLRRR